MRHKLFQVLLLLIACDLSFAGHYTIVGPQTGIVGSEYKASLISMKDEEQLTVRLLNETKTEISWRTLTLDKSKIQDIKFDIPSNEKSEKYFLEAKIGRESAKVFEKEIKILKKKFSIFTQTDKAIYKRGDKVRFRILVFDANMKPYQFNKLRIIFTDGDKKVAEKIDINYEPTVMIHEGSFKKTNKLIVGKCGIHVNLEGSTTTHNFQIVDYDLPEFDVIVEPTKKHTLVKDSRLGVTISAKYLYGKGQTFVTGNATVTATVYEPGKYNVSLTSSTKKVDDIKSTKSVVFGMKNDLKINGKYNITELHVKMHVVFEEDSTKRQAIGKTVIFVHESDQFHSEIVGEKDFLTPGQPYRMKVLIRNFDGYPATGNGEVTLKSNVLIYDSCELDSKTSKEKKAAMMDKTERLNQGSAEFVINVPNGIHGIIFGVKYNDKFQHHKRFRIPTKTRQNLEIYQQTIDRSKVTVKVVTTYDVKRMYSLITGRSGIIHHQSHDFEEEMTEFNLTIPISPEMLSSVIPISNLIVYCIHPYGEIIFSQMTLQFEDLLANDLEVELESENVVPGGTATIKVKTTPNSVVGLLSEDERVSIFENFNEISEERVRNQLNSLFYSNVYNTTWDDIYNNTMKRIKPYLLLGKSNAFLLTDSSDNIKPDCAISTRTGESEGEFVPYSEDNVEENPFSNILNHFTSDQIPETWLFKNISVDENGEQSFSQKVPFASTSYAISGFSVHPVLGLGLSKPKILKTLKKFLPEINAPLSVKLYETFIVKVFLHNFNQTSSDQRIEMSLYNDDSSFELLQKSTQAAQYNRPTTVCRYDVSKNQTEATMLLSMSMAGANVVIFYVKAIKAGTFKLRAKAKFGSTSEETFKTIHFEDSGLQKSINKVKLFDLRSLKYDSFYFDMPIDENVHPNSIQIKASATGDLLGPALTNIEEVLEAPVGTTSQHLVTHISSSFVLNYLKSVNQLNDHKRVVGRERLERGYRYVLTQKLGSPHVGAFREWNDDSPDISTTANVAKFLAVTSQWIEVDDSNIVDALTYLKRKQQKSGSFLKDDKENVELTALVAIAFLENQVYYVQQFQGQINKALNFLSSKLQSENNNLVLAMSAYALALGKHSSAKNSLEKLDNAAIIENGHKFWDSGIPSQDVATASYAILAHERLKSHLKNTEILNWLIDQRNENGGFHSSMDTIIGIQAVSKMAEYFYSDNNDINLKFNYGENQEQTIRLSTSGKKNHEKIDISSTRGVSVQASGNGIAYVQVWQTYLLKLPENSEKFTINIMDLKHTSMDTFALEFCVIYKLEGKSTNTIAEVALPSGYVFDSNSFSHPKVQKAYTALGKSKVNLFFVEISNQRTCVEITARRQFFVSSTSPYPVKVYEEDDSDKYSVNYYIPFRAPVCEN